ncbi:MAG: hypothetical protein PHE13_06585 [Bacteroidales bacterium]|jgi:hypothetical protein|nr:hypothetical protein [Bacteroidales bacterium]MDD4830152.1 hypothetical protein [Bacteroidales bacterium]
MKKLINIILIAIILLFAASCTDENDLKNNYSSNPFNYKSLNDSHKKFYEYEINNYKEEEMIQIIERFDSLINYGKTPLSNYNINQAVFAMEMFFNYAIVDKQENFDTSINYEQKIFQFTVDLNEDNTINPIQLRTKYRDFLNNILSSMGNKYIQFSDFYVEEKTNSSIKFGLYIPQYNRKTYIHRHQNYVKKVKPLNSNISVGGTITYWGWRIHRHEQEFNVYYSTIEFVPGLYTELYAYWVDDIRISSLGNSSYNKRYSDDTIMFIDSPVYDDTIIPRTYDFLYQYVDYIINNFTQGGDLRNKIVLNYNPVYDWDSTGSQYYTGNNDLISHFMLLQMIMMGKIIDPFNSQYYNQMNAAVSRLEYIR